MTRSNSLFLLASIFILLATACGTGATIDSVSLRSESAELSEAEITEALNAKFLNCPGLEISGSLRNQFESVVLGEDKVVNDHSTGLMWQQGEPDTRFSWKEAEAYIAQVNAEEFAGFSDWRLPTVEELASLLTSSQNGDFYISDTFEKTGLLGTWTSDIAKDAVGGAWFVSFMDGKPMEGNRLAGLGHVRLVRSR